jgi:5'-methylthioadenosine phosphorylase
LRGKEKKMATKKQNEKVKIAVIGGSGLYEIEGIKDVREISVKTPFGNPSDKIIIGTIEGVRCAFLPRHARGHRILPSELNSRANIYALKSLGVEQILSISACGSLKEELKPRDFVIPDQLFDRTKSRVSTFFGNGVVGHVGFAEPFCNSMRREIRDCLNELKFANHFGGTYVCIEGPAYSTKAESLVNRSLGFSIVGMTAIPEAKLAREAEICYATVGLVTDYDVWKEGEEVSTDLLLANLHANVSNSKKFIQLVLPRLAKNKAACGCSEALKYAMMTKLDNRSKKTFKKLDLLLGKYYR